jgi:hypothetical protein
MAVRKHHSSKTIKTEDKYVIELEMHVCPQKFYFADALLLKEISSTLQIKSSSSPRI